MNWIGLKTIYKKEIDRMFRVAGQTLISPALTTALYFVVFGSAIGSNIDLGQSITYGQFIVPGLIMMSLLTNSLSAASSGIYFPKFIGTIYEFLSAPLSYLELTLGYVGAAVTRSMIIGIIIYLIALLFTPIPVIHPVLAIIFALLTATSFALFGFIIGIWADSFEKLSVFPVLVITPLSFLGGVFYSLEMLPPVWQTISLFNPIVYMISGLRWSFYGISDIDPAISFGLICVFMLACIGILAYIFKTGYRIKN
jgi:ABC-2 type transport system permease protein